MCAVSIRSNITVALGDHVDVLLVGKEQEASAVLENVEVAAVSRRGSVAHRPEAEKETGVVTILVSADEAKRLWDANGHGNFRLRLRKAD
jgi:Flp pilus assembly protein CpaB